MPALLRLGLGAEGWFGFVDPQWVHLADVEFGLSLVQALAVVAGCG